MASQWRDNLQKTKTPTEVLDYPVLVTLDSGDSIASIIVTGVDITIDSSSFSGNVITIWISGGTIDVMGRVTMKITTTNTTPRIFERSFNIKVLDR